MQETAIGAYREINLLTADPPKMILMCYGLAISSFKAAKEHYLAGEYEAKAKALQKALDIISELDIALDFDKGGKIAENLHALYGFIREHILQADIKRDLDAFDGVITIMEELDEAWNYVVNGMKNKKEPVLPSPLYAIGSGGISPSRIWSV